MCKKSTVFPNKLVKYCQLVCNKNGYTSIKNQPKHKTMEWSAYLNQGHPRNWCQAYIIILDNTIKSHWQTHECVVSVLLNIFSKIQQSWHYNCNCPMAVFLWMWNVAFFHVSDHKHQFKTKTKKKKPCSFNSVASVVVFSAMIKHRYQYMMSRNWIMFQGKKQTS